MGDRRGGLDSLLRVNARVPNMSTVDIPAPTAASVKATSTASKVTSKPADNKLKAPVNATTANK